MSGVRVTEKIVEKTKYIGELMAGMELQSEPFLLHDVARRQSKDGRPFLLTVLRDRTGQVNGIFWDVPPIVDAWAQAGLAVLVTGRINTYKDALQVGITNMERSAGLDRAVFLPNSRRSRETMLAELGDHIASLSEPWRALVTHLLLEGPDAEQFAIAPAASGMHHAYIGGLLEHTLSMADVANLLTKHYTQADRDLLLAGVLLHDVGKTREYTLEEGFTRSDDGRLIGHIVRGMMMVENTAAALDFPEVERQQLLHLIAAHHGTNEWGSPVVPKTLEAVILHQIDLLDSRVGGFMDHINSDSSGESWTTRRSEMFGTQLQRPRDTARPTRRN